MLYFPALLLPLLADLIMAGLPSQTYSVPQACDAHRTNLIRAVAGVNTVAECKQLYRNFVINCSVLHDCPDC